MSRSRWLITKRSDHGQYFRGLAGLGTASSPVTAEWTPYPNGGQPFTSARAAFRGAHNVWGDDISNVRVVRRWKRGVS